MTAAASGVVEEIVARCLVEPAFLDAVRADPAGALAAYDLADSDRAAFQAADFGRLRQFSGFIGKVQHNFLWESFPATRRLLRRHGIELEVFARYRGLQLEPETRAAGQDEKIRRFLSFLEDYLDGSGRYPALQTVMRHERAVWEIRRAASPPAARCKGLRTKALARLPWREFARLVPGVNGVLRIETFNCDPVALTARVLEDRPSRLRRRPRLMVYWLDRSTARLRTLAVETLPALLLSQVDGRRPIGAIVSVIRRRSLAEAPSSAFRPFFEDAARDGLISLVAKDR
jgi:hypothetical protein